MAFPAIDLIAGFWGSIFGGGILMGLVIVGLTVLLLAAARANVATILMVIVPLMTGLVLNAAFSDFVDIPAWVLIMMIAVMGFIFATIFFVITK